MKVKADERERRRRGTSATRVDRALEMDAGSWLGKSYLTGGLTVGAFGGFERCGGGGEKLLGGSATTTDYGTYQNRSMPHTYTCSQALRLLYYYSIAAQESELQRRGTVWARPSLERIWGDDGSLVQQLVFAALLLLASP